MQCKIIIQYITKKKNSAFHMRHGFLYNTVMSADGREFNPPPSRDCSVSFHHKADGRSSYTRIIKNKLVVRTQAKYEPARQEYVKMCS